MTKYKNSTVVIAAMVALCAANGLSATYTNKWTGAANNLIFDDAANWESQNEGKTAADLLADTCGSNRIVYDFGELADKTEIKLSSKAKQYLTEILVSGSESSSWKLYGASSERSFCFRGSAPRWVVRGGTLNIAVNNFINWDGDGNDLTITGGGTVRICHPSAYSPSYYHPAIAVHGAGTRLILAHASSFYYNSIYLYPNTVLELECDSKIGYLESSADAAAANVILNGHKLTDYVGPRYATSNSGIYYGKVTGPGTIAVGGCGQQVFRRQLPANVAFVQSQGDFIFGTASAPTHPADPFPFTINMHARSFFYDDVTFSTLSGVGVTGSPVLPAGKTITVAGSGAANEQSHFQSAITGDVSVVKSGANYELELSGENGYRGATTVSSGTLSISAPIHREGLIAYYGFEDENNLGRDGSDCGTHLRQGVSVKVGSVADGAIGKAAHFTADGSGMRLESGTRSDSATYSNGAVLSPRFPKGTNAFSVSVWFRPSGACPYNGNIIQFAMSQSSRSVCAFSMVFRDGSTATDRKTVMVNFKDTGYTYTSPTKLNDGNWHHLATIQSNGYFRTYLDGVAVLSGRPYKSETYNQIDLGEGPLFIGYGDLWGDASAYDGDIDEVMIFDRVLSPDEIQAEYALKRPAPDLDYDPVAALPEPLCQWTFDDSANLGKDSGAARMDLEVSGTVNSVSSTSVIPHKGGAIQLAGGYLKLPDGAAMPEDFPSGNESFTVFVRAMNNGTGEQSGLVSWGTATSYHLFELGVNSFQRCWQLMFEATANNNTMSSGDDLAGQGSMSAILRWTDLVASYDGKQRMMSFYMNGVFKGVRRTRAAGLALDMANFMIGARADNSVRFKGYVDEVRIYNRALSCGEVRLLEETFWDDARGPVIPASSELTVADGATFKVAAGAHTVAQGVKGAGTIEVSKVASACLANMSDFTGSLAGLGSLTLADTTFGGSIGSFAGTLTVDDSSVTLPSAKSDCAFALKDGAVVKIAALSALPFTAVAASGEVTIDVSSVVDQLKGKSVKVFSLPAASVAKDASFTVVGNGAKIVAAEYDAEGGALNLRVRQGFSILLR